MTICPNLVDAKHPDRQAVRQAPVAMLEPPAVQHYQSTSTPILGQPHTRMSVISTAVIVEAAARIQVSSRTRRSSEGRESALIGLQAIRGHLAQRHGIREHYHYKVFRVPCTDVYILPENIGAYRRSWRRAHHDLIGMAGEKYKGLRRTSQATHSPNVLVYLERVLDDRLPRPTYSS